MTVEAEIETSALAAWLTLVGEVVSSASWPIAICVIAWIFRRELRLLIGRVRSVGFGGATAELSEALGQAEALSMASKGIDAPAANDSEQAIARDPGLPATPEPSADDRRVESEEQSERAAPSVKRPIYESIFEAFNILAQHQPSLAIVYAWKRFQDFVLDLANETSAQRQLSFEEARKHLERTGRIDTFTSIVIDQLGLSAAIAKDADATTTSDAVRFRSLMEDVVLRLRLHPVSVALDLQLDP